MMKRDVLSPDLARAIEQASGPLLVVVTFRKRPSQRLLKEFGLDTAPNGQAAGPLEPSAILQLAQRPGVRAIALSPAASAATVPTNPKLDANLSALLWDNSDEQYPVAVTFRTLPSPEVLAAHALPSGGPGTLVTGVLGKGQILDLAGRDDVVYIQYRRPPEPAG